MVLGEKGIRDYLRQGNFRELFVRELGWDRYSEELRIELPPDTYLLKGQAEKRGMGVFVCEPGPDGQIPNPAVRRKIEKQVAKSVHEHIIIYTDAGGTTQVWQWVRREAGKPDRPREYTLHTGQSGEPLIQRLNAISFALDEEANLGIVEVTGRVRSAFDVDKVTKRFYDRFKTEHDDFVKFIQGITEQGDREWYASLMLNRLMFVYFIQKKGFLDGDRDYLRNRLKMVQRRRGQDRFLSFYRYFLLRLFHEGLGQSQRSPELDSLLGTVPYLNGGLFDVHQLEQQYAGIEIPDEAFERIFDFFDQYEWHLDTRPLRKDNEINPDVLGYIFEKYINQKQMGAYYTKEDITGYISKNTVIPFLFDDAKKRCAIAFEPGGSVWLLLRDNPERYIYEAVRRGVDIPLPDNIAAGVHDVTKRQDWNRPADSDHALPTETWREHVARRERCYEVRKKLASGQVTDINDLITDNLDIVQFAEDVIDDCEGPELLRALYRAIENVTILDPTCGSGAFLFAALNILEPLYDACLDRMQAFVNELDRSAERHSPRKYQDFRETLADMARHPNRAYFILKSIILNNLYGVDIMEEAVEIAKLRLFLTLVAQVERVDQIEPLPDIDFNIRAGNTLVGFATYAQAEAAVTSRIDWDNAMQRIGDRAEDIERLSDQFRRQQTRHGGDVTPADKQELRRRLADLDLELDRYLATEYGISPDDPTALERWRAAHRPFHWFVEFYSIMTAGGFDVIIGNPPWKEYAEVKKVYTVRGYKTERCGNLHNLCTERALQLRSATGWLSFIVQLPFVNSSRMVKARNLLRSASLALFVATFDDRPGKLFEGLEHCRSVIFLSRGPDCPGDHGLLVTRYHRWSSAYRPNLFTTLEFVVAGDVQLHPGIFPKLAGRDAESIFEKVSAVGCGSVAKLLNPRATQNFIFYQEATQYWVKATVGLPFYAKNGHVGPPAHGRYLYFNSSEEAHAVCALLNSSLFYTYFITYGDCFHLSATLTSAFPTPSGIGRTSRLEELSRRLMDGLKESAERATIRTKDGDVIEYDEYYGRKCKSIIGEIDRALGGSFGFTDDEIDFILNYDIKFRTGLDGEGQRKS